MRMGYFEISKLKLILKLISLKLMDQLNWILYAFLRKATGSYRTHSIPSKSAALFPEFTVEDLPLAEVQPRFLRLQ